MSIVVFFFLVVILLSSSGYTVSYGSYFQKRRQSSVAKKITQRPKINQEINFPEVRVVLSSSDNRSDISLGVLSMERALFEAENRSLDLVLINEAALPPVCKIVDAGKHMYCVEKRAKDMQKRQSKSDIKEIKLSFNIDDHDVNVRVKLAEKFMEAGDRVIVFYNYLFILALLLYFSLGKGNGSIQRKGDEEERT